MKKKTIEETIGVGRRKTAVASVRVRKGSGQIKINDRDLADYFPGKLDQRAVLSPIEECNLNDQYDLLVSVKGGGVQAQAQAVRLGVARALVKESQERRPTLKGLGFLRRDARKKERKKYGLRKARKSAQFSKR